MRAELEGRVFEELIEELEELSHDGGEGDLGGFAGGAQALVKVAQVRVETAGAERGHIESGAEAGAAAGDMALALEGAAVVGKRSDPEEGRSLIAREGAELRAEARTAESGDGTDAGDLAQAGGPGAEGFLGGDQLRHGGLEFFDVAPEELAPGLGAGANELVGLIGELAGEPTALLHGLRAGDDELLEPGLGGSGRLIGPWLNDGAEIAKGLGIDGIGPGKAAEAFGKVADLARIDDTDEDAGGVGGADEGAVASAGGLTNQMSPLGQPGEKAAMARGGIGQRAGELRAFEIELLLGKIDADRDGRRSGSGCRMVGISGQSRHEAMG